MFHVQEREERAVSEKIQLEQKLKLQRVELQKQANQIQSAEDKTRAELHELQVSALCRHNGGMQMSMSMGREGQCEIMEIRHTLKL